MPDTLLLNASSARSPESRLLSDQPKNKRAFGAPHRLVTSNTDLTSGVIRQAFCRLHLFMTETALFNFCWFQTQFYCIFQSLCSSTFLITHSHAKKTHGFLLKSLTVSSAKSAKQIAPNIILSRHLITIILAPLTQNHYSDSIIPIVDGNENQMLSLASRNRKPWPLQPEKTADIWLRYHWFPRQMTSEKRAQKFHTDDASLPRSGQCF